MKFLKKNAFKIFLLSITLAGVCIFATLLAHYDPMNYGVMRDSALGIDAGPDPRNAKGFLFMYIASMVFFLMMTVFVVMSMFKATRRYNKWTVLVAGIMGLTLMLCSALMPLRSDQYALLHEIRNGERNENIQLYTQSQVIFGTGEQELMMFATMPMNEWHIAAESLADLADMSAAELADLIEALDYIMEIVAEESALAIDEAKSRAYYEYLQNTIIRVGLLILYGSIPLVYGLKMVMTKKSEEKCEGVLPNGAKKKS